MNAVNLLQENSPARIALPGLAREPEPILELREEVSAFVDLETRAAFFSTDELFHQVVGAVHQLCLRILECERAGTPRPEILRALEPARKIHARSPFILRLQRWPRGYPGDFETIEYLCSERANSSEDFCAPEGAVEHVSEQYALTCAAAQQHRNRIQCQANLIAETVARRPSARILIIACGSCPDLALAIPALRGRSFECVLNDADPDALVLAERRLGEIRGQITLRHSDAWRLLRGSGRLGQFDLVLAGGLFDYLLDRQIEFILGAVYHRLLRPGGVFYFTNIAQANPYRLWMSYLADWHLASRSPEDLAGLAIKAGIPEALHIERDQTGLTLMARVIKLGKRVGLRDPARRD